MEQVGHRGMSRWGLEVAALWCLAAFPLVGCDQESIGAIDVQCPEGAVEQDGACLFPVQIAVGPVRVGPARLGRAFVVQFEAAGGDAPYTFATEGPLPAGLTLSASGQLEGTPTEAGQFNFSLVATDSADLEGQAEVTLLVEDRACEGVEVCNGIDDDCDGQIDEDVTDAGEVCGPEEGVCQRGSLVCQGGELVCEGVVEQGEEVCDGEDNDCDGQIDEDVLNACGECGPVPEEVCDGEDNDCDGNIDEDLLNACGECGEVPEEICDGEDNDCDGLTDEDVLNACGECGPAPEEVCDGQDNNCNGEIDEGVDCPCQPNERERCGTDEGECRFGERVCVNGNWGPCEGGQGPSDEVCDGEDNNCNGEDDEGVLNRCGECGPVPEEVCDGQDNDCDGDTDEGLLNACGECGPVPQEVCDGQDNDCDGDTDEGVQRVFFRDADGDGFGGAQTREACEAPNGFVTRGGDCNDDNGDINPDADERCNGGDDNCNGNRDEGLENMGPCEVDNNLGQCPGLLTCRNGEEVCEGAPPTDEVCDGADNDCDGAIDEDAEGVGERCGEGPEVCEQGRFDCVEGELVCEGIVEREPEVCDGEDNDCDGAIDEDAEDVGEPCDVDRCGAGTTACVDGGVICDVAPLDRGTVLTAPVESGFNRAYTGDETPFIAPNNQTSHSVLITSDGERIYNVSYGIDGVPFAGWTVKIFVPEPDGLVLQEEITIPVDWGDFDAPEFGFAGAAAHDGFIQVLNVASNQSDGQVWLLDLESAEAEVDYFWDGRNTFESPAEYDWVNGIFWTMQLNARNPTVFRYPQSGIDPVDEEDRFQVQIPSENNFLGTIAADGVHLYGNIYSNGLNPAVTPMWRFGSGEGTTFPGGNPEVFAQVKQAASITYHRDGFIYVPDQNNLGQVQRVAATVGSSEEVCDGVDNDCDGETDEGVCDEVDLEVVSALAFQLGDGQEVEVQYTVVNISGGDAGEREDFMALASLDAPTVSLANLGVFERGPLDGFGVESHEEVVTIPDNIPPGEYLLVVVADFRGVIPDVNRANNVFRAPFDYFSDVEVCDPDRLEPNDRQGQAQAVGRFSFEGDLWVCPGDEDWYSVQVPGNRGQTIFLEFDHGDGNLDIIVYDEDLNEVDSGTSEDDDEFVRFRNDANGTERFFIQVFQTGTNNLVDYSLAMGGF